MVCTGIYFMKLVHIYKSKLFITMYIPNKTPRDRARTVNCYHGLKGSLVWAVGSIPTNMRPGSPSTWVSEFTIPTPFKWKKIYQGVFTVWDLSKRVRAITRWNNKGHKCPASAKLWEKYKEKGFRDVWHYVNRLLLAIYLCTAWNICSLQRTFLSWSP